jgi:hypothetical protein
MACKGGNVLRSRSIGKWLATFLIICVVATVFVAGCAAPAKPPPTGSMVVSPTKATISLAFGLTITGSGFKPGEKIAIWIVKAMPTGENFGLDFAPSTTTIDGDIFVTADASGAFNAATHKDVLVPPQMTPGTYTLKAIGQASGTTATATVEFVAAAKK